MTIKEILIETNKIVSYPWSPEKLDRAGIKDSKKFLTEIVEKIKKADDYNSRNETTKELIKIVEKL